MSFKIGYNCREFKNFIVLKFKFVCVDNIRWVKRFFGIDFGLKIGICS